MFGLDWQDLLSAIALVMVFEGIGPFLFPDGWRRLMRTVSETSPVTMRTSGFILMLAGLVLLNLVR
ncbi:MAG: DUF2065 domain-containing protein [Chromatiales bacterium]|jgi:uncharacterized protein|nr:DUF2065 domain-containing protein [Chromatiales bacterium]